MQKLDFNEKENTSTLSGLYLESEDVISFQAKIPKPIQQAMIDFIGQHPNWDQYRLIQAAVSGFLVQNGISSRLITRLYIQNMFGCHSF